MGLRRLRPYLEYKDSGVEWLGAIPIRWDLKRLKRVVRFRGGGTPSKDNPEYWRGDIPWVSPKDMKAWIVVDTEDKITAQAIKESATKTVPAGAVLIVVRSGILNHSIPVAVAGCEVTLNQDLKALIAGDELAPRYLAYLIAGMQGPLLVEWRKEGATVESLELELIASTPTPLPAVAEQRAIAAFLDQETAKIDALVAKKERLIELLQEKRTAIITRGVTKGLDPNVSMKDSGVEWLGEIPAHWEVRRLRHVAGRLGVGVVVTPSQYVAAEGVPFLYGSDIQEGAILADQSRRMSAQDSRLLDKSMLHADDLVMVRVGAPGFTAVVPADLEGTNCASMLIIRRHERFDSSWLCCVLNSRCVRSQIQVVQYGAAQEQFNVAHAVNFLVPFPPLAEQTAIRSALHSSRAALEAVIKTTREAIDRLKEYRTALISAAVTGKIDVREA